MILDRVKVTEQFHLILIIDTLTLHKPSLHVFRFSASCPLIEVMKPVIIECNEPYSLINEDRRNYTMDWNLDPENYTCGPDCTDVEKSFKYHVNMTLY